MQERGVPVDRQVVNMLLSGTARVGDLVTAMRLWDAYFVPYGGCTRARRQ